MVNGEKLPYEEYILDRNKMVLLSDHDMQIVAQSIDERIERVKAERKISYEAAKHLILNEYKIMRAANMLPEHYIVEDDPEYFDKLLEFSAKGIRNVSTLSAAEYDRRKAFTIIYMENGDVI